MTKEKTGHKITKKHIKVVMGIILVLFSVFVMLNYGFISTAINYASVFLFGNLYFVPFVILVYFGGTLIFKPVFKRISKKVFVVLGSIFLILALLMSLCFVISVPGEAGSIITYENLNLANFYSIFSSQIEGIYQFNTPILVFVGNYGGGFIGYFLVASINTILTSSIGTIIIVAALFILALIFYCYYPIKALVIYARNDSKIKDFKTAKKSKKEIHAEPVEPVKEVEEEEEDLNAEVEGLIVSSVEIKSNTPIIETKRTIPSQETGFIKPTFGLFEDEIDIAPVKEEVIVYPTQTQTQPVVEQQVYEQPRVEEPVQTYQQNYYEQEYEEEDYYEDIPAAEPEIAYENDETYDYDFKEEPVVEEVEETTDFGFVSEQTLSNSVNNEFVKEEIHTPEPPVSLPRQERQVTAPVRTVISELPEEETPVSFDVIINPQAKQRRYIAQSVDLLKDYSLDPETVEENKRLNDERINTINNIFDHLKVGAKATGYTVGPSVTRFDIFPNRDVSVSYIEKYVSDLSSRLGGVLARFEKIVQGKTSSALEIPNQKSTMVGFKESFLDLPKKKPGADLTVPFGKNIDGINIGANLAKFPHLLVSGSTGSGKSVYVNSLIITLLLRNSPDDLKLLIIDPKEVEFSRYNGIPHLLGPVVSSSTKAKIALDRLAEEMDNRYSFLKEYDYTDIKDYNEEAEARGLPKLPYIVCIIDEYADLIENDKTISSPVTRISQKARACGIHLVIATQRPSTAVITGTIKSNIPVRVAFMASSGVDSRVMLDQNGAESLVGNGDMLVQCQVISRNNLIRAQGSFISSLEIKNVLSKLKETYSPEYDPKFTNLTLMDEFAPSNEGGGAPSYLDQKNTDPIYPKVREYVYSLKYCSISNIQRTFNVGFNRAGKILNQLIKDGIISADEGLSSKGKEVIIHSEAEYNDKVLDSEII